MKEAFEKIIERLEEEHKFAEEDAERYEKGNSNHFKYAKARGYVNAMEVAIEIVNQVAEENKNKYVSIGAYKQVAWERDIAIEQLHELGYEFGQKIDVSDINVGSNDGLITLPKVAFDRMIARMESESEKDWNDEEWFINVRDAARIIREIAEEYGKDINVRSSNSEIPNMSNDGWIKQQCTCEKLVTNEFTIKEIPFSWNDNLSEVALEDFSMIQSRLSYGACQSIGMALAKLKLLEEQGCEVKGEEHE